LAHTIFVLVTVGLGHGVYRKLYTLIGGQRAEKFENHCCKQTTFHKLNVRLSIIRSVIDLLFFYLYGAYLKQKCLISVFQNMPAVSGIFCPARQ